MSTNNILVYEVEMDGTKCYFETLRSAVDSAYVDLIDLTIEDIGSILATSITISLVAMSERKFRSLPEFEGY